MISQSRAEKKDAGRIQIRRWEQPTIKKRDEIATRQSFNPVLGEPFLDSTIAAHPIVHDMQIAACSDRSNLSAWFESCRFLRVVILAGFICHSEAVALEGGIEEKLLATRSGPRGATLFAQLPATETGVITTNAYDDPKMWNERYHELEIGAIGCGVAIGDYDNDGRPDLFVASKVENCRLFRNLGNFKFEDTTEKAGVQEKGSAGVVWKQGVAMADVNNDGWLDIYVCRFNAPNLLYINRRNGTFEESAKAYGLDVNDASNMAAFCDYDRDGWLDLYLQTNLLSSSQHPGGQKDYLFHNNRDGTFTNAGSRAGVGDVETQGHSVVWWDYNNDGWPDIYVANDFDGPDLLYRNNQNGTFTNAIDQVVPHMSFSSMGSDLGDVNNDGLIDFMVADMAATTQQKDQRTMADARARNLDPSETSITAPSYQRNALYLNTNTGKMQEAAFLTGLSATDWTWSIRFEDLDNDGRIDLHVTNGMYREIHNADLLWKMMTAESPQERVRVARLSPPFPEAHLAFRNLGDLHFENTSHAWGLDQSGVSFGAAFGDLDGDGDLDLIYTNYQAGVALFRNDSDSGHRLIIALQGTKSNHDGVGATIRLESAGGIQVRQLSLARGYLSTSEPVLHFGLGKDEVVTRLEVSWPSGQQQVFENLAADRHYKITEPSAPLIATPLPERKPRVQFEDVSEVTNLKWVAREELVNEIDQQRLLPTRFNRRGPGLAVADINGDGREDILMGGTSLNGARILLGSESGKFEAMEAPNPPLSNPVNDGPVLIFDANGDGKNDLLITKGGNSQPAGAPEYQPSLFLNDGTSFKSASPDALPALSISAGAVAAADFNHDGQLDLFIGARVQPGQYPQAPHSALLTNQNGKFSEVTEAMAPSLKEVGMVTSAMWSDVDNDGWPDLLLTLEWGSIKYYHNEKGRSFEDWTEKSGFASAGTGWWQSIATGDFNRDGRLDYVVGNVGLNTQYRADSGHPALLYHGEFKEGGDPLAIEARYEGDKLYPWRSRKDLGAAIPSLLKRFPRNDLFSRATLGQVVGEQKLNTAQKFAATELRSGVLLSQPNGTFRFDPLPTIAQIAPLQGIVCADFNGDGNTDIYAVQNSYAPAPVVTRFDGGISQLLRGDEQGKFFPIPPAESGLVVNGDAKALVLFDPNNDGWPDLMLTRNNSSTSAFLNKGTEESVSFRVTLKGNAGNSSAIGARVTVVFEDASTQTVEIQAGAGYWSQSPACGFFASPKSNPARNIKVRWPSGIFSEHQIAPHTGTIELIAPSS